MRKVARGCGEIQRLGKSVLKDFTRGMRRDQEMICFVDVCEGFSPGGVAGPCSAGYYVTPFLS